jgi:hypothetical protein
MEENISMKEDKDMQFINRMMSIQEEKEFEDGVLS